MRVQQKRGFASSFHPRPKTATCAASHQQSPDYGEMCNNRDVTFKPKMWVTWRPEYQRRLSEMFQANGPFQLTGVEGSIVANDPHAHHQRLYMEEVTGINGMFLMPLVN